VAKKASSLPQVLDKLEAHYGRQTPQWPTEPYDFMVWWHCGYPASDAACAKGWAALNAAMQISPEALLAAKPAQLAAALKAGGMVPELRAMRLKEIAARVKDLYGGDLRAALAVPAQRARKILKQFPNIGDPGADRILLFAGIAPLAAVPSNNVQVLVRIFYGKERENYGLNYRQAQQSIEEELPAKFDARTRAFLLLKIHGQELCKRTKPKCEQCPVNGDCAYFAGKSRGVSAKAAIGSRR
jgi:endonuclease-3